MFAGSEKESLDDGEMYHTLIDHYPQKKEKETKEKNYQDAFSLKVRNLDRKLFCLQPVLWT